MLNELRDIVMSNQRALIVMIVFIALDVVTGVLKAIVEGKLNSTKLKEGIFHKILEVIVIIVGVFLDFLLEVNYIANSVTIALVGMEGISILENIGNYIPLPDVLRKVIEQLSQNDHTEI